MKTKKTNNYIPSQLYNQIMTLLPIASVEAVIVVGKSLLFMKRKNQPAAGQWWFPGGRILKGETLEEALLREIKEETGLKVTSHKFINVYSRIFPERHDITVAFLCECKEDKITLDDEHSEYQLFTDMPKGLHPHINQLILDSKWQK